MGDSRSSQTNRSLNVFSQKLETELMSLRGLLKEKTLELQSLLKSSNIHVNVSENAFADFSLPTIDGISTAQAILENLTNRIEIVSSAIQQDIALDDSRGLFWLACRKFNFKPQMEFLDQIKEDDVLEIYNVADDYKQIFSNFKFWEMVSYPINTILTHSFDELYHRDQHQIGKVIQTIRTCIEHKQTISFNLEPHAMKEKFSDKRYEFLTEFNIVSPLMDRDTHTTSCIVSTISAKKLN